MLDFLIASIKFYEPKVASGTYNYCCFDFYLNANAHMYVSDLGRFAKRISIEKINTLV